MKYAKIIKWISKFARNKFTVCNFIFAHQQKMNAHKFTANIVTTDNNYCVDVCAVWGASYRIVEAETEDFTAPVSKTHKNSLSARNDYLFIIYHCVRTGD